MAHPFAQDAGAVEAKCTVPQHREKMQEDAAEAGAREDHPVSVPEVGFGAVRRPGGIEGPEHLVAAEDPIADLVLDEDLLLVGEMTHA